MLDSQSYGSIPVHIVIATYNRSDLLDRTLESLSQATLPPVFGCCYVVENGSDAASGVIDRYQAMMPLRYHRLTTSGKSQALDWAVAEIGHGLVIFLDDDMRVHPELIVHYTHAAQQCGPGHFFGGPVRIDYPDGAPPHWLKSYLPRSVTGWEPADPPSVEEIRFYFLGGNTAAFAEDVIAVGGFRKDLGPGAMRPGTEGNPVGQEYEFQLRMAAAGMAPQYVRNAIAWHYVPSDRCTPEWALHRAYRQAYSTALIDSARTRNNRFANVTYTVKLLRRAAGRYVRALFANAFADEERKFYAKRRLQVVRGRLAGHLAKHREAASSP